MALPAIAISSSATAKGVERLRAAGLPVEIIPRNSYVSDGEFSNACFALCEDKSVDIICLCGFIKKLVVPKDWIGRILNIHPGPLPRFGGVGMYGHAVHEAVLDAGVYESGPTVHLVDNEYDHGKILAHTPVSVMPGDTAESLQKRVYEAEMKLYPKILQVFLNNYPAKGN